MNKKIQIALSVFIILVSLFVLQRLFMPKYVSDVVEGRLIEEYYKDDPDHDVVFIGDCEVYENFSPVVLWQDFGINSFIRGSAQQLIWQSYYLLEDTLRYEKPKVVIFNVLSMQYNEPQKEAYNRMSIEGMDWSMAKVQDIQASMTSKEQFLDYVFPILRYHARWNDLKAEDLTYMFRDKTVSHNGYYMRVDVKPAENVPEGKLLADYHFGDTAYAYLDKITDLCKKNDIQLVLVKAPSLYPYWYPEWEEQMEDYAAAHDLCYINFLELRDETQLDFSRDTYDGGLHLNLSGAEKITKYLGEYLKSNTSVPDRRDDPALQAKWAEKIAAYNNDRDSQFERITAS